MSKKELGYTWWKIYSYIFTVLNILTFSFFWMGFYGTEEFGYAFEFFISIGITIAIFLSLLIYSLSLGRKSFLIMTIFSFNPIIWIINGIYLKNRWTDLSS